jgi:glycosyltransferase involved in cell wall biosynthesis
MRILFLSTWFPNPPDNGSKLRVYHLLEALAQQHQITLLSFAFATAEPEHRGALQAWCEALHVVPLDPFAANRAGSLRTFLSARPVASRPIPAMSQLVTETVRAHKFAAVIASTEMTASYALLVPQDTIKILEAHNSMSRWMHDRFQNAASAPQRVRCWASWQKCRRHEAKYYPYFDLVTMVSEQDRAVTAATVGKCPPRVESVPNGVDTRHNRPGLAVAEPCRLVYNGALTYSANYDAMQYFLAEIYPLIKTAVPEVSLAITGSTKGVDLDGLALDESVRLTGYVEDVRIPVAEAAVCVTPIRQGGGTRLKILEAMALGTAVVSTSKGAEGLDVADGEHLLLADTPQAFAQSVVSLLRDPAQRQQLATAARQRVEDQYDWRQIGQQFVRLVEEVVAAKKSLQKESAVGA